MILFTIALLALMEVALSFDNAVLNAGVLKSMNTVWQNRFITWGMPVAVLGMRLAFPIFIVAIAGNLAVPEVVHLAVYQPILYSAQLAAHHIEISAFGGMFLLMVFLNFILNPGGEREVFWLTRLEQRLTQLGKLKGIEIILSLGSLVAITYFLNSPAEQLSALIAGIIGIGLYILIDAASSLFNTDGIRNGLMGFIYLEILDASCSLDGVIAAFVLTNNIFLIMGGLGLGALAIRSLTLRLVRGGTLQEYIYLEHGAHYGIGALAIIMLIDTFHSVPEPITGCIGMLFIGAAMLSSLLEKRNV